jgi:hypothetical protein
MINDNLKLEEYFDNEDENQSIKNWGGFGDEEEDFDAMEFFGDAGDAAQSDIEDEFGKDEFTAFGTMEDPRMLKKLNRIHEEKILRQKIREMLSESKIFQEEEIDLEEERIANPKAKSFVNNKENFIGSHIFGEDLGGLGKMYVAYSYGEQFPVYVWTNNKWYHNTDSYIHDGEVVDATEKHKEDMRPSAQTSGMSLRGLQNMIKSFMKKNGIKDVSHTEVEPGEKN